MRETERSPRNKTLTLTHADKDALYSQLRSMEDEFSENSVIKGDCLDVIKGLPDNFGRSAYC